MGKINVGGGGLKLNLTKMTKTASENIAAGDFVYPSLGNKVRKTRQLDTLMVESFVDYNSAVNVVGGYAPETSAFISDEIVVSVKGQYIEVDKIGSDGIITKGPKISTGISQAIAIFPLGENSFFTIWNENTYQILIRQYSVNPTTLVATLVDSNFINVQSSGGYAMQLYSCKYAKDNAGKHRLMILPSWRTSNNTTYYHGLIQFAWDDSVTALDNIAVSSMITLGSAENTYHNAAQSVAYDKATDKVLVIFPTNNAMTAGYLFAVTWNKVNGSAQAQTSINLNYSIQSFEIEQFDTATVLKLSPSNTDVYKVNATSPPSLTLVAGNINYNNSLKKTSNESFHVQNNSDSGRTYFSVLGGTITKRNTSPVPIGNIGSISFYLGGLDNKVMSIMVPSYLTNGEGARDVMLPTKDNLGRVQHNHKLFLSGLVDVTKGYCGANSGPNFFYNHRSDTYYLGIPVSVEGTNYNRLYKLVKSKEQALGIATKAATTNNPCEFYLLGGQ